MLQEQEVWKEIEDCKGDYMISNLSNVKSFKKGVERILKPSYSSGYYRISLSISGKVFNRTIHRLKAITFIPNPLNLPCINHIDGNKLNNDLDNLEWCTYSENGLHSFRVLGNAGSLKGIIGGNHPASRSVYQYSKDGELIKKWDSIREADKSIGVDGSAISKCCKGIFRQAGGFIWKYN